MIFSRVSLEANPRCATIYVAGFLADDAASLAEQIIAALQPQIGVLRVDLRAVDLIDPTSFVRFARALNQWRDIRRGRRVTIEFPRRSRREAPREVGRETSRERRHLHVVGQASRTEEALSFA
jgi:hypothetical protein